MPMRAAIILSAALVWAPVHVSAAINSIPNTLAQMGPSRAPEDPSEALQRRVPADEQWLLSAVLSDESQKAAFDAEARKAMAAGAAEQADFLMRWRKKELAFAQEYARYVASTDIVKDAPTVEKMVSDYEFTVMNYWLMHQPADKQKEVMKDISDGNAALGWFRGTVEGRVRANRKKAADELMSYLNSKSVKEVLAYAPPGTKPPADQAKAPPKTPPAAQPPSDQAKVPPPGEKTPPMGEQVPAAPGPVGKTPGQDSALDQARQGAANGNAAAGDGSLEGAAGRSDTTFAGSAPGAGSDTPVFAGEQGVPPPGGGAALPGADISGGLFASPGSPGGFHIKPPPAPLINREEPQKSGSSFGFIAKKALPPAGGAILGGILGFLFGGPIGMIIGALAGGAIGYGAGKLLSR